MVLTAHTTLFQPQRSQRLKCTPKSHHHKNQEHHGSDNFQQLHAIAKRVEDRKTIDAVNVDAFFYEHFVCLQILANLGEVFDFKSGVSPGCFCDVFHANMELNIRNL